MWQVYQEDASTPVGFECGGPTDLPPEDRTRDHITDALISLHWLRAPERIQYKLAILAYRGLHGDAPRYLGPLIRVDHLPGRRPLRSSNTNRLVVPQVKLSTVGTCESFFCVRIESRIESAVRFHFESNFRIESAVYTTQAITPSNELQGAPCRRTVYLSRTRV